MRHATIVDIAQKLGVAPSTVSRALRNHPDVSPATKAQIEKLAKQLHYSPNPIAQSLKSNRTMTIGVLVPEIEHDFFSSAISGIEEIAYRSGYTIIVCQSDESYEREVVNTNMLMQHRVAGVIVSISQETKTGAHFQALLRRKIPLVFFDRVCDDVRASKVVMGDCESARNAVMHLLRRGYKRIAHFAGPRELGICIERKRGYTLALQDAGISLPDGFIRYGGLHEEDGYRSMSQMLVESLRPDALFAVNDPVAIGAFQRIKEAGLKIPTDIAIVGFSNNKITALVDPPLTTVNQNSFEMGKKAAEILIHDIEQGTSEPQTYTLKSDLIVRGST
jgi:DNA-binding LacI/PurR family transcriptional regulator